MDKKARMIFRAIHEGKWLKIKYNGGTEEETRFWIAVKKMYPESGTLIVDGLQLREYTIRELKLFFNKINDAEIVEGTYCPENKGLIQDIEEYPEKYAAYFGNTENLKILDYLEMCNRLDTTPYQTKYRLIEHLDDSCMEKEIYPLSEDQYSDIIKRFHSRAGRVQGKTKGGEEFRQLAMNILSVYTQKGLYILAYRNLDLDVVEHCLRPSSEISICREFQLDQTTRESARRYLDADDYELLDDFENNQELIKDRISSYDSRNMVDDRPYIFTVGRKVIANLHEEYEAIVEMYENGKMTVPLNAFFGNILDRPRRVKDYPMALANRKVNMDQLLAIHTAVKYPLTYVQGPPGTGKTNTIINTIVTAFFNDKTVLFSSYNNHPLDAVYEKLAGMKYRDQTIPFPALRLGNREKVEEAIEQIKALMIQAESIRVYPSALDKRKESRAERARKLSGLLKDYEEYLDLKEREEALQKMLEYQRQTSESLNMIPFTADIQGRQLDKIRHRMNEKTPVSEERALEYVDSDEEELMQYLYFRSASYLKRLSSDSFNEFRQILDCPDKELQWESFTKYIREPQNLKRLQKVFPIIVTTCLSAGRLGKPEPIFDMVIIDEASQCNTAVSLMPIIRGENLMLVGDPQQLNPVILLDEVTNAKLREKYRIPEEYDYRKNSIYKTFLASDSVSDEILLHTHYRCHQKIIEFNNVKYYNSQLVVRSESGEAKPLIFVNVHSEKEPIRNTSEEEARQIVAFAEANKDRSIGVITPFVNQKKLIEERLKEAGIENVPCGTVHSFQGDEKSVIIFSAAIGEGTSNGTYGWLCGNKELINVATSRARDKLVMLGDEKNIQRLARESGDDFWELVSYVKENGQSVVTPKQTGSRALGVKPFSTETEEAFLETLTHALGNIWLSEKKYLVQKEVAVSQVFNNCNDYDLLFYMGRFDFVVYERSGNQAIPVLVIELDGKEHHDDETVKKRDQRKAAICRAHNLQLIRVENTYARRYAYIKGILADYFSVRH